MPVELKDAVEGVIKAPVSPTKTEALTLEGKLPLSSEYAYAVGDRVLLPAQKEAAQNGIFELTKSESFGGEGTFGGTGTFGSGSNWTLARTEDADSEADIHKGMMVLAQDEGITKGTWVLTSDDPIKPGVTPQEFASLQAPETSGHAKIRWAGGTQFSEGKAVEHGLGTTPTSVTLTAETYPGTLVEVNLAENPNMDGKQFTIIGYAALLAPPKGAEITVQWTAKA